MCHIGSIVGTFEIIICLYTIIVKLIIYLILDLELGNYFHSTCESNSHVII